MVLPRKRGIRAAEVALPKLSAHWHPSGCKCELARPYIRVSKVGSREQVISPELQLSAIENYARTHNLRLLPPVCDINRSGRTFRKRSVDKLIKEVEEGICQRIVLWKWSRWARNTEESAKYLKYVRDAGGRVDSATEDFDQETAIGKLQLGIMREFDTYTSNVMQETWLGVHARRREAGLPHGGRDRFGYDYIELRDGDGILTGKAYVKNDREAEIVKELYRAYNSGQSYNKLLVYMKSTGTTTTLGGQWTAQGIARMMDTGFAAGLIRERSTPSEKPSNSIKDYDVWRPGVHDAIIDRKTWEAYKARRVRQAGLPPRLRKPAHELSGLMFCVLCRRRLVTKYGGVGRTHQWQCAWQKAFHPGVAVTVNNRLALEALRAWVRELVGDEINMSALRHRAVAELTATKDQHKSEQQLLKEEIQELQDKIENLLDLAETVKGPARERIDARLALYSAQIDTLKERLAPEPPQVRVFEEADQEAFRELDSVWDELPSEVINEALGRLISRIEVAPRSQRSSRKSAADRVLPVGLWERPELVEWRAARPALSEAVA